MYKNNIYKHAAYRLNVPPGETKDYRNLPFSHKSPPIIFPRLSTKDTPSNLYNIPTLLLTFSYKIIFRKSPGDSFQVSDYYQVKYYIWQYELTKQLTILQCLLNITQSCLHKQDDCDEENELSKLNVSVHSSVLISAAPAAGPLPLPPFAAKHSASPDVTSPVGFNCSGACLRAKLV